VCVFSAVCFFYWYRALPLSSQNTVPHWGKHENVGIKFEAQAHLLGYYVAFSEVSEEHTSSTFRIEEHDEHVASKNSFSFELITDNFRTSAVHGGESRGYGVRECDV
jgi:hypothetical protein